MLTTTVKAYASRLLPQNQFVRAVSILAGGTLTAQLLIIGTTPILSRLYTPADFGLVALFVAVSGILGTALTLRYETVILLPKEEDESVAVVLLCVTLALALGSLAGVAAWLSPEDFKATIGIAELGGWLPITAIAATASAVVATGTMWLNRQRAYKKMAQIRITQSAVAVLIAILLGLTGLGTGLVVAQIIALLVVMVVIIVYIMPLLNQWEPHALMLAARKHLSAPKFLLPTALLDVLTMQLPVLLITAWYSTEAAGQFSMAWRILALPAALIGSSIGQVFFQRISKEFHESVYLIQRSYLIVTFVLSGLVIPIIFLIAKFGVEIFDFVLGPDWADSGKIAQLLVFSTSMYFIFSPTSSILLVLQKQKILFGFSLLQLSYRVVVGLVAHDVNEYVRLLVICEIVNVILFEFIIIRMMHSKCRAKT